jgi:hypothetical protein
VDKSPVPSFIWQQPYQYTPLPSQLIAQQEMDKDSDARVLIADDVTLNGLVTKSGKQSQEGGFGWMWDMDYGTYR